MLARAGDDDVVPVHERQDPTGRRDARQDVGELSWINRHAERVHDGVLAENGQVDQHQLAAGRRADIEAGHGGLAGFEHLSVHGQQHGIRHPRQLGAERQVRVDDLLPGPVAHGDELAASALQRDGACVEGGEVALDERRGRRQRLESGQRADNLGVGRARYLLREAFGGRAIVVALGQPEFPKRDRGKHSKRDQDRRHEQDQPGARRRGAGPAGMRDSP